MAIIEFTKNKVYIINFPQNQKGFGCIVAAVNSQSFVIRALVSARGSEQKRNKQMQSPRLKSRLPVPLYVFMTKTENRNFRRLIKQFPPGRFIQKSSQEFLFWLQTTSQNLKLNRYIGQELHRLEIWQN